MLSLVCTYRFIGRERPINHDIFLPNKKRIGWSATGKDGG